METSQLKWIDTHCHIYAAEFDPDRDEMLSRAISSGVTRMMMPNIDLESIAPMISLAESFPLHCIPMMGLHPCSVKDNYREVMDEIKTLLSSRPFRGIGETGIDLYWDTTFMKEQIEAFEQQIAWAKEFDLPVIIHSRESLDLNIDIITRNQDGNLRGIFHCFSGTPDQVKQIADVGFKVGIGGVVTFKKAGLAELLPQMPLDMIVLETDSPYLAPAPHRGKRNEPSYILLVAHRVAESLDLPLEQVSKLTYDNAEAVFGKLD